MTTENNSLSLITDTHREELLTLAPFVTKKINITPLTGGLHCFMYKIETEQHETGQCSYVAKRHLSNESLLNELYGQTLAANVNQTAKVVFSDNRWIISTFIEGILLSDTQLSLIAKAKLILTAAANVHQILVTKQLTVPNFSELNFNGLKTLDKKAVLNTLISQINKTLKETITYRTAIKTALELAEIKDQTCENSTFIHGDLNFSNAIMLIEAQKHSKSIKLIDFEACALTSVEYELAMMFAVNLVPIEQHKALISFYLLSREKSIKIQTKIVTRNLVVAAIVNALWYLAQFKTRKIKIYYLKAIEQFEFANEAIKQLKMR